MSSWQERVVAAASDWVYVPPDAPTAVTDEYALVGYPETFDLRTQVARIRSSAVPADLVAEVEGLAAGWGRTEVAWWIDAGTAPSGLAAYLLDHGAIPAETVTVLALDLTGPLPDFVVPDGVTASVARDEAGLRAFARAEAAAWQKAEPTDDYVPRWAADLAGGTVRVVGSVGGTPCATGGLTLVADVARLWGGATDPAYRGRGAYRAVLAERLRVAREHGATLGLVKGRVATSAPILRRLGFQAFDDERAYLKRVSR